MDDNDINETTVSGCIRAIRTSSKYDDVSVELFKQLVGKDNLPYSEWVETWLIKCITEYSKTAQKGAIKRDVLFASFALLPGYTLEGTTVKERLNYYLYHSDYLKMYPSKSKYSIEEITDKKELEKIRKKLERFDRKCLEELINYIEDTSTKKHFENLEEYGKLITSSNNKVILLPKAIGLNFPKTSTLIQLSNKEHGGKTETIIVSNMTYTENISYECDCVELRRILNYYLNKYVIWDNSKRCQVIDTADTQEFYEAIEAVSGIPNLDFSDKFSYPDSTFNRYRWLYSEELEAMNPTISQRIHVQNEKIYTVRLFIKRKEYDFLYSVPVPIEIDADIQINTGNQNNILFQIKYPAIPEKSYEPKYNVEHSYIRFYSDRAFHLEYIRGSTFLEDPKINDIGKLPLCPYNLCDMEDYILPMDYNSDGASHILCVLNTKFMWFPFLERACLPKNYPYGCFISLQVKAILDNSYNILVGIRHTNNQNWDTSIRAKINETVEFIFIYVNLDDIPHSNVSIYIDLPNCISYIRGSTSICRSSYSDAITISRDTIVDSSGLNIGSYAPGEGSIIRIATMLIEPEYDDYTHKWAGTNIYFCMISGRVGKTILERRVTIELNK